MDERLKFVARLLDGEKMAVLYREFEISRKTGYKIWSRYKDCGLKGLTDRSRRPYRQANQLPFQVEKWVVALKQDHPSWGCGRICLGRRKSSLSKVFAGQNVGIKEISDKIWLVTFMQYDMGFFDHETCRLESADNPFAAKLLPMSPV
jgi:Homeodomain-like domain